MAKRNFLEEGEKRPVNKEGFKRLAGIFKFMLPYRWMFAFGLVALGLSSGILLSFPYFAGQMLDVAQGKKSFIFTTVNQIGITLMSILVIQSVFSFIRVYTFTQVSERTLADLRQAVYSKIIWLPMSFFDSRRVGELTSRLTSDVGTLQDVFTFTLAELLRQILILVIGIPLIFFLTPKLALFMLLTFPVLVIAALVFGKFIRKMSKKSQDQLAQSNVIVEETLQSIAVVKAFTNELFEIVRYKKSLSDVVTTAIRTAKYRGLFISFTILAFFGGIVAVGWYGAYLLQNDIITVGELFSFIFYTSFIGASIAGLGDIYSQLQRSIGASERILEILDTKDEQPLPSQSLKLQGNIRFENVSFEYPSRTDYPILKSISIHIKSGEKIALVGASGAGKSTITSLLMRLYSIQQGSIEVDGQLIEEYNLSAYRNNIGTVPQEVILFGGTILENIAYGKPNATEAEVIAAAQKANAWEFIDGFPEKLKTVVGDRGIKLSGGQRQRVAIARAILKDPAILILDEATSSLDAKSERLVQDALEKLMENRTTIVIAHRLSTIRKVDRILVIKDGQVAESGSHQQLSANETGIYANLLRLQLEIS
ncbi:MAG: ATP-binding cassette domain-containing protein [Chryseotalea sp. WA131a]|nr:MAG: ATP-binding cassette domain-containing protein [Chryseotalea sp. WA131a]